MIEAPFFDTSVLVSGLLQVGASWEPAQRLLARAADRRFGRATTAWHCCLELYSVSTRLPAEYRLAPVDALRVLEESVLAHFVVEDLPKRARLPFLRGAVADAVAGGRTYDAHVAEIARLARCDVVITENVRHFAGLARHGIRVGTASEIGAA